MSQIELGALGEVTRAKCGSGEDKRPGMNLTTLVTPHLFLFGTGE